MPCRSFAVICILIATLPDSARADEIYVAVAANFTAAMETIGAQFETESDHKLLISYGSTGKLYAQIRHGAPFQVFLAADAERPRRLEREDLAVLGSRFTYAVGRLVLWSPRPDRVDQEGKVLQSGNFNHLAMANPKTAPYGAAAQQILVNMGLLETLSSHLIQGDNISQTYQFVATGNAELGFIALSQIALLEKEQQGSAWLVPQALYDPLVQQAVLLTRGKDHTAARAFLDFLKSRQAQDIIERSGYGLATPGASP